MSTTNMAPASAVRAADSRFGASPMPESSTALACLTGDVDASPPTPAEREHEALVACADNLRAAIWDWQEAAGIDSRHTPADYRIFGDKLRALYEDAMALAASREGTE